MRRVAREVRNLYFRVECGDHRFEGLTRKAQGVEDDPRTEDVYFLVNGLSIAEVYLFGSAVAFRCVLADVSF